MFDGNGNWTSDFSAQADRDNGIKILASRFDNIFIADIKESFENCLTKDGQITPIGAFNMGGQKITNLANGTNSGDAVNKGQLDLKADDSAVVKLTGNQTIADVKTFTSSPIIPTPATTDNSTKAATTAYVMSAITNRFPDYANRVSKNANTDYTADKDGLLFIFGQENNGTRYVTINGVDFPYIYHIGDGRSSSTAQFFLKQGDTYKVGSADTGNTIYFIPFR